MKDTRRTRPPQGGCADSPRPALPYCQIPLALLTLPTGERAAAIEVWAALHHHLRLGSSPQRITDEELSGCPWLVARSLEHARKGLEVLERLELIVRVAKGSSRRVGIVARLMAGRKDLSKRADNIRKPIQANHSEASQTEAFVPVANWSKSFWGLVQGN